MKRHEACKGCTFDGDCLFQEDDSVLDCEDVLKHEGVFDEPCDD